MATANPTPDPTPEPTAEPTTAPSPVPTPVPTTEPAPVTSPTIASDLEDYPPGGLVTLTGAGWQPGEVVHITVNDNVGSSWTRSVDVTADAGGAIVDQFNLPNWFVAQYAVVAIGPASGTALTTFTDGSVRVRTVGAGANAATIDWTLFSAANCTGSVVQTGSTVATTGGNGADIGSGTSNSSVASNDGPADLGICVQLLV